jgi:hypothetical protein
MQIEPFPQSPGIKSDTTKPKLTSQSSENQKISLKFHPCKVYEKSSKFIKNPQSSSDSSKILKFHLKLTNKTFVR